jgi:chemotaxis protein methyltransferase CheR
MIATAAADKMRGAEVLAHPEFHRLKQRVIAASGLQYYADNEETLAERVEQRRLALGCGWTEYFRRVLDADDREELAALVDDITVGETYFFRYPEQFEALRRVIVPERIARRNADRTLRIWSAGCASGAEPYSVAVLLRRDLAGLMAGWRYAILGTDINRKALAGARVGLFSDWELRTATDEMKRQCFVPVDNAWSLRPEYRDGVHFEHQNLVTDIDAFAAAHREGFDIILCRNVMIYFGPDLMRHLLRRFVDCLAPGGWLIVGHAEPYFEIANFLAPTKVAGTTVYRKLDGAAHEAGRWSIEQGPIDLGPGEPVTMDLEAGEPDLLPPLPPAAPLEDTRPVRPLAARPPAAAPRADAVAGPTAHEMIRRHAATGAWSAAVEACEQALQCNPLDATLHYAKALIFEHTGMLAQTEQALGRAIYLDRAFALAHYHLGRCRASRGDKRAAAQSFANAVRVLVGRDDAATLTMGDGLTVAELRELIAIQSDLLERP